MIRIKCPKCKKPLTLDDADAGVVAACPDCGQKFRVPAAKAAATQPAPAGPAAKKHWQEDEEDSSPYQVTAEEDPEEQRKNRPKIKLEAEKPISEKDRQEARRRRRLAEKPDLIPAGLFTALVWLLVLVGAGLGTLAFLRPQAAIIPILVGVPIWLAGTIWFIVTAFVDDGMGAGLCCIFVPFYATYYRATNPDRENKPYLVRFLGFLLAVAGGVALYLRIRAENAGT